jgi:hypothetical protein
LLVVLNKLDAVSEENAICWAQALQRIPGIAAVLGYSKEDLRHRNFGDLQLGKEALIDAWCRFLMILLGDMWEFVKTPRLFV